jgi:hypothetical protein
VQPCSFVHERAYLFGDRQCALSGDAFLVRSYSPTIAFFTVTSHNWGIAPPEKRGFDLQFDDRWYANQENGGSVRTLAFVAAKAGAGI